MAYLYDLKSHTSILTKGILKRTRYLTRCYRELDAPTRVGFRKLTRSVICHSPDCRSHSSHDHFAFTLSNVIPRPSTGFTHQRNWDIRAICARGVARPPGSSCIEPEVISPFTPQGIFPMLSCLYITSRQLQPQSYTPCRYLGNIQSNSQKVFWLHPYNHSPLRPTPPETNYR